MLLCEVSFATKHEYRTLQGLKSSVTDEIATAAICGLAMTTPQITCERTFVV